MEKFIELLKENPKKAIVVAICILVFAIGNFVVGCAGRVHFDKIDNFTVESHGVK